MEKRSVAGAPRILDGHNDVLLELSRGGRGFLGRDDTGHVDLPRALEGGFGGGLFACFIPNPEEEWDMGTALTITGTGYEVAMAPPLNPSYAREMADLQIAELFRIEPVPEGGSRSSGTSRSLPGACTLTSWPPCCTSRGPKTWARILEDWKTFTAWGCAP